MERKRKSRKKKQAAERKPVWDARSGEVMVDGLLLRRFARRAVNIWALLCALEKQGWPRHTDNPIPPRPGRNNQHQLREAIKCLNAALGARLHFHGNGAGTGLWWEFVRSSPSEKSLRRTALRLMENGVVD